MKSDKNLKEFIESLKNTPTDIPADTVKSLIDAGKSSPFVANRSFQPKRVKQMFNPLKLLVMIAPIVIIMSALLIWNPGKKPDTEVSQHISEPIVSGKAINNQLIIDHQTTQISTAKPAQNINRNAEPVIKDTIIRGIILDLSKEELTRLGFMFDAEGFYYLNRLPNGNLVSLWSWKSGKHTSGGFEESKSAHRFNKQMVSDLDFYPLLSTTLAGKDIHMIYDKGSITADSFNSMNDTLVPVLFRASAFCSNFTNDLLLWFKPSEKFFELIGNEKAMNTKERIQLVKNLTTNSFIQKDRVIFDFASDSLFNTGQIEPQKTIQISADVFACLGISVTTESVDIKFFDKGIQYRWSVNKYGVGVSRENSKLKNQNSQPASNNLQSETPAIYAIGTDINNRVTSYRVGLRIESADLLIPVQIADSYLAPYIRKLIFWVYPNDQFFSCLPPEIAKPMQTEFNYQKKQLNQNPTRNTGGRIDIREEPLVRDTIRKGYSSGYLIEENADQHSKDESVPCIYFTNLCESMPGLDHVNLYPNPASDKLNVELVLLHAKKIRFRVFDMNGRLVADDGAPENYTEASQYRHQLDISRLKSGFYLLVMVDETGAKLTRRFVKD